MKTNRFNANLSPSDQKAVLDAIATIKQKLPFLSDLTVEERRALPKLGEKGRAFVSKAMETAAQNPNSLPLYLDVDKMRHDVQLFEAMQPIALALLQLLVLVDNTQLAVGGDAYAAALAVHQYVHAGGQCQALDALAAELGGRFAHMT